jgi:hypothetical protein
VGPKSAAAKGAPAKKGRQSVPDQLAAWAQAHSLALAVTVPTVFIVVIVLLSVTA